MFDWDDLTEVPKPEEPRRGESTWRPPLRAGSFHLGERLWAGMAGLEQVPDCEFFPRMFYGSVVIPPAKKGAGCALLLLGGSGGPDKGGLDNDVWRLNVPRLGIRRTVGADGNPVRPRWMLISPSDRGEIDGSGRRILRKWMRRGDFGLCAAAADSGGLLIYVAGGNGAATSFSDIWASQDGGSSWLCMNSQAPWGRRAAPAVCAVPGKPDRLLLAGGFGQQAEVCEDVWISDDAGVSWTELARPIWAKECGRYRAAFLPLPRNDTNEHGEARMLLLGGCFIDGGGGGYGGLERLMHDGWECRVDFSSVTKAQAASWHPWGTSWEQRGKEYAVRGVEFATATMDSQNSTLIARLPEKDFVSVAEARKPNTESIEWHQVELATDSEVTRGRLRSVTPITEAEQMVHVRFADFGSHAVISRLALINAEGVFLSGDGEWRRHVRFALLLGARLEAACGLPGDLWRGRVLPSLLPAVLPPERHQRMRRKHVGSSSTSATSMP